MPWQKGQSGNELGRPPSSGSRQKLFDEIIGPRKKELLQKALKMALEENNEHILKTFLDRLLPAKPKEEPFAIDLKQAAFGSAKELLNINTLAIESMCKGTLAPTEAEKLSALIKNQFQCLALEEMSQDIRSIQDQIDEIQKIRGSNNNNI